MAFYIESNEMFADVVFDRLNQIKQTGYYTGSYPDVIFHLDELDEYTKEFLDDVNGVLVITPFYMSSDTFNFYVGFNQDTAGVNNCIEVLEISIPIRKLAGVTIPDLGNYIIRLWNVYSCIGGEQVDVRN